MYKKEKGFRVYRYWIDLDGRPWNYIGYTGLSLNNRAGGLTGRNYIKKETRFGFAIETYGWSNFNREVLEVVETEEEAKEREKYWIEYYNSRVQGFNVALGSEDVHSARPREKGLVISPKRKIVLQYDKTGKIIAEFNSTFDASAKTGIAQSSIVRACNHIKGYKTAGGYGWAYQRTN